MERGQDGEVDKPFQLAGVTLGHSVNLSCLFLLTNELGRLTTSTICVTVLLYENACENAFVSHKTLCAYIRLTCGCSG